MAEKQNNKKPIHDVSWYDDKYQSIVVFRNWMFLITLVSLMGIFAMTMASYYFVPLKSVSPFVIQIDEGTGVTKVVRSQNEQDFTSNDMLVRYFAYKYIMARENYTYDTFLENMNIVRLMSVSEISRPYIDASYGKDGIYTKYRDSVTRTARVLTMTDPTTNFTSGEKTVVADLEVTEQLGTLTVTKKSTVRLTGLFNSKFNLSELERRINPLSFTVTAYDRQDLIPPSAGGR